MNISIAIADIDREYAERLSDVLQQYAELTVYIYTNAEKLLTAMESRQFDVVLFDPDICEKKLAFSKVKFPVCLYSDEAYNRGLYADFAKVAKYQCISSIYKEIVKGYADKAGYTADFDHSQATDIIAVYSPAGGSGKTTMALAIAARLNGMGRSTLFISVEQLNSASCVNSEQENGITALVEGINDENINFELKVKGIMKQGLNGIAYIEGFERIVDYEAVTDSEIRDVLDKIRRLGLCDFIVVDMESCLDAFGKAVFELANHIVVVEKPGEFPTAKYRLFAYQALMNEYRGKMVKICNFAENQSEFCNELNIPVIGTVHNYGNLPIKNLIQAVNSNGEIAVDGFRENGEA